MWEALRTCYQIENYIRPHHTNRLSSHNWQWNQWNGTARRASGILAASAWPARSQGPALSSAARKPLPVSWTDIMLYILWQLTRGGIMIFLHLYLTLQYITSLCPGSSPSTIQYNPPHAMHRSSKRHCYTLTNPKHSFQLRISDCSPRRHLFALSYLACRSHSPKKHVAFKCLVNRVLSQSPWVLLAHQLATC